MKKSITFFFFSFFTVFITSLNAANYYVNYNLGNDNNNGLTSDLPFKTIAKLNTKALIAGDKIFFARGSVWKETFNVNYNGTSAAPIVISAYGTGALPLIDGELTRANGIYIYQRSYITVKNINIINQTGSGAIRVKSSSNIVVDSCVFYVTGHGGVFIENSTNCFICHNTITTPSTSFNAETDGIYSQRNSNINFNGNDIVISNLHVDQHCDGIQSYLDTSLTFCNNKIRQDNPKTYNAQGIYVTTGAGNFIAYNNVINCPNTTSSSLAVDNLSTGTASAEVYNNTLINGGYNCLMVDVTSLKAKNNIFKTLDNGAAIDIVSTVTPSNIDNNIFYNSASSTSNMVYYRSAYKTLSQWKAMGCDLNGKYSNPALNSDGSINQTSSAVDAGTEISTDYNVDVVGTSRPQLNGIDVGAFEYASVLPVELTTFTGTVLNNIVILKWRTATEINNSGFDVERSKGSEWVKVGFIQGAGNSNSYIDYTFSDTDPGSGKLSYRLKQIDLNGAFKYSPVVQLVFGTPKNYSISQNYPNPFNPSTKLKYYIPQDSKVDISVFNITGQKVSNLINSNKEAGSYELSWDAKNLPSGIYLLRINAEGLNGSNSFTDVRKLTLIK